MDESEKQAVLYSLVERMNQHGWTGKTQVQKLVFFAQEAAGIDFEFRYVIHHYGPYSFDLNTFMQSLDARGVLRITRENDGYGFNVKAGDRGDDWKIDEKVDRKIKVVGDYLGGVNTGELELLSTCFYIARRFPDTPREEQIRRVRELKPRFDEAQVRKGIDEAVQIAAALRAA